MVREKFPGVRLLANGKNVGFARGNNAALREASGRYVLLINPDTIVQEDTLKVMIEFLEKNPDVGLAGCTILNPDGSLQFACRRSFPTPWIAFIKIIGLSVDPVDSHAKWSADILDTQGHAPNYPMIGDPDLKVAKLYGMLPAATPGTSEGRTPADNQTVRSEAPKRQKIVYPARETALKLSWMVLLRPPEIYGRHVMGGSRVNQH